MNPETLNLLIKTGGLVTLFIFLIGLVIRHWPKDDLEMKHTTGSSFKYSKNYGLFQTIFHVIGWVFRWAKINPVKIMETMNELSVKDKTKSSNIDKDKKSRSRTTQS